MRQSPIQVILKFKAQMSDSCLRKIIANMHCSKCVTEHVSVGTNRLPAVKSDTSLGPAAGAKGQRTDRKSGLVQAAWTPQLMMMQAEAVDLWSAKSFEI